MKLIKAIRTVVLTFMCVSLIGISAFAVDSDAYPNIHVQATSSHVALTGTGNCFEISPSSGYAIFSATTTGTNAVTSVTASVVVQRKVNGVWENVPNTHHVATKDGSRIVAVYGERFLNKGYWYRLQSVHVAFIGTMSETEVMYSAVHWYN